MGHTRLLKSALTIVAVTLVFALALAGCSNPSGDTGSGNDANLTPFQGKWRSVNPHSGTTNYKEITFTSNRFECKYDDSSLVGSTTGTFTVTNTEITFIPDQKNSWWSGYTTRYTLDGNTLRFLDTIWTTLYDVNGRGISDFLFEGTYVRQSGGSDTGGGQGLNNSLNGTWVMYDKGAELTAIFNNGNWESFYNGVPDSRGRYTTNGSSITVTPTHVYNGKWYTVNEAIAAGMPASLTSPRTARYSVNGNTLTLVYDGRADIWTRKNENNNNGGSFSIVGTWVCTTPHDWPSFTFNSNFTFIMRYYGTSGGTENGTYSVSGNVITLIMDVMLESGIRTFNVQIIDNNTIRIYGKNSYGSTYSSTYVRQ